MYKKKGNPTIFLQLKILQTLLPALDLLIPHKCSKRKKVVKQPAGPLKVAVPFHAICFLPFWPRGGWEKRYGGKVTSHCLPLSLYSPFL